MALFPQDALNDGVRKREVFGWAMYDFANSGYTTVVLTAVFNAYFVGVVAAGADWAPSRGPLLIALSSALVMLTMPALGAYADLRAAKKRLLALTTAGCVAATAALALAGRGDLWLAARRRRAVEPVLFVRRVADRVVPARAGTAAMRWAASRAGAGASATSAACWRSGLCLAVRAGGAGEAARPRRSSCR